MKRKPGAALDASRFANRSCPKQRNVAARWFYDLSPERQDYLISVAKLFQSGQATWSATATFEQIRTEFPLAVGKTQFTAFLLGRVAYKNFLSEVQDARTKRAEQAEEEKPRSAAKPRRG